MTATPLIEASYALSPMQRGMLYHSVEGRVPGQDVMQFGCTLDAAVELPALRTAWCDTVARHPILRTAFRDDGTGNMRQEIHSKVDFPWRVIDWRSQPRSSDYRERRDVFLREDRHAGFDLKNPPLMRLAVLLTANQAPELVWTFHHILLDGRSIALVLQEVFARYAAVREASTYDPPPVTPFRQYIDFLSALNTRDSESFWREQLRGIERPSIVPLPEPRNYTREDRFTEQELVLDRELDASLKNIIEGCGVSWNNLVQGAWALLLHRYSGDTDVVFGATRACRHSVPGGSSMVGLLINTVPFRVSCQPDQTVAEFLTSLKVLQQRLRDHEHTPLSDIQRCSELPPGAALFESVLVYENVDLQELLESGGEGWSARHPYLLQQTGYPLTLGAFRKGTLVLQIGSDRSRYDDEAVSRMLRHLEVLLRGIAGGHLGRIGDLNLLTDAEQHQLIHEWNQGHSKDCSGLLHSAFEQVARTDPDKTAVRHKSSSVTYGELEAKAARLAASLCTQGIARGSKVGVLMERSIPALAVVLAVLKAGATYVPLNPRDPIARTRLIAADAQLALIVADQATADFHVPCLDLSALEALNQKSGDRFAPASLSDIAYIIYTSGSTAEPKGVCIRHRSAAQYVQAAAARFELSSDDRVLQFSSFSFDASIEEIFATLSAGSTLVLRTEQMITSIASFLDACRELRITVLDLPTAYWHELAGQMFRQRLSLPSDIRLVVIGGEAAQYERVREWRQAVGRRVSLLNLYGPTEATISSTLFDTTDVPIESGPVPIGRPFAGARVYIVDSERRLVPVGVPGELWIGGPGVAQGYLNRPERTEHSFRPDPYSGNPDDRLYPSGDLVRYRPDGNLEFLGRIDGQVKVRGFRIELGEIEARLLRDDRVLNAVATLRRSPAGDQCLVAYVVTTASNLSAGSFSRQLREALRDHLPAHMIPRVVVRVPALPLKATGKVDHQALSDPDWSLFSEEGQHVAPRDKVEERLARLWERHLRVPVGVTDNFFELGGHSLLAVHLYYDVERIWGRALPLSTLLQAPTVEGMAKLLRDKGWTPPRSPLVPIQSAGSQPPLFCVHAGGANVLFYRDLARRLGPDQPLFALQPKGVDGSEPPLRRIEDMAAYYLDAVRAHQPHGPYRLGGASFGGVVAFEMAQQLRAAGEEVALLALFDTYGPGYPRPLPGQSRFRAWIDRWQDVFHHHCEALAARSASDKARYVARKGLKGGQELAQQIRRAAFRNSQRISRLVHAAVGRPLPPTLRRTQDAFTEAHERYRFTPYPGIITLLRADRQPRAIYEDPTSGWGPYAAGGIDIRQIPGDHGGILSEPWVAETARVLSECLQQSEAAQLQTAAAAS